MILPLYQIYISMFYAIGGATSALCFTHRKQCFSFALFMSTRLMNGDIQLIRFGNKVEVSQNNLIILTYEYLFYCVSFQETNHKSTSFHSLRFASRLQFRQSSPLKPCFRTHYNLQPQNRKEKQQAVVVFLYGFALEITS